VTSNHLLIVSFPLVWVLGSLLLSRISSSSSLAAVAVAAAGLKRHSFAKTSSRTADSLGLSVLSSSESRTVAAGDDETVSAQVCEMREVEVEEEGERSEFEDEKQRKTKAVLSVRTD
jgi:hypothetical protein